MHLASLEIGDTKDAMHMRYLPFLVLFGVAMTSQYGCAALAGGAVGAAIGHEVAEEEEEEEENGD